MHDLGQGHPDFRSRSPWLQIKVPQTDLGEGVAGVVCRQWLSQHAPVTLQKVSHTKINIILKDKLSLILDHSWCKQNDTWADNKPMHVSHADGGLTDLGVFNIGEMTSPLLDGQHTPGLQNGPVQRKKYTMWMGRWTMRLFTRTQGYLFASEFVLVTLHLHSALTIRHDTTISHV